MGEDERSGEIDNISIEKIENGRFRILLGTETDIPGLYSASEGIEIDRDLLEEFIRSAREALGEDEEDGDDED